MKESVSIFWFRRDLRLNDNKALYHALSSGAPVVCLFIFDPYILNKLPEDDARVGFIHSTLADIKSKLKDYKSDLIVKFGTPKEVWASLLEEFNIKEVFANEDYEPYAIKRDTNIRRILKKEEIPLNLFKDQFIFAKNDILKKDGSPYKVFTPYKKRWLELIKYPDVLSFPSGKMLKNLKRLPKQNFPTLEDLSFTESSIKIPPRVIKKKVLSNYHLDRDTPSINGTSKLGVHLRFGTLSVRKCVAIALEENDVWLSELIWREFFGQILFHYPNVTKGPFKEKYTGLPWLNNTKDFRRWCEGKTGFPLVDAGMRELNATGFMHNRVRMVTASFLVKNLLINWQWGEKYFAEKLLDFDLAANNGNWQWVAGTGCDAAPYFRIFNPDNQIKRFDPEFAYIKKWVPEYGTDLYPDPMVDQKASYQRAIMFYQGALNETA